MPLQPIAIEPEADAPALPAPHFEVRLDVFAGPLDLLLHLIESRELDVLTVPLAELADAYVEHLASHPVAAEQLADFVAVASQLILIKSRRLLPGEPATVVMDAADEPDEEELRRRLVEYRVLRDAARELGERDGRSPAYRREPRESDLPEAPAAPLPASVLAEALDRLAAIPEPEPPPPEVVPREVTIAMQLAVLRSALAASGRVVLQQLLAACRSRTEATVTIMAMLELVRRRDARVRQDELFGPILLERPEGAAG
ncbi:MAG TPA: segregation/condensation protein A [Candidatus Limnocylindria bacterium]|nr:segregation/condensation protein A [Candidatus Limnocylindria bacterium]